MTLPHHPTAYYWVGRANFGDLLTPLLLAHYSGVEVAWAPKDEADLVCVGSILEHLPETFSGLVVGSGKLKENSKIHLPLATILALRGPLTAKAFPPGDFALGDPGLLADELVRIDRDTELGLVPHWSDVELEHRPEFLKYNPIIIRPGGDPIEVLRQIGRCRKIISSSLHGIIVADAFGIPRRTEMTKIFQKEGGTYKFRDYNESVHNPFEIGITQEAPRYYVQDRQHEIYDVLVDVGRRLTEDIAA